MAQTLSLHCTSDWLLFFLLRRYTAAGWMFRGLWGVSWPRIGTSVVNGRQQLMMMQHRYKAALLRTDVDAASLDVATPHRLTSCDGLRELVGEQSWFISEYCYSKTLVNLDTRRGRAASRQRSPTGCRRTDPGVLSGRTRHMFNPSLSVTAQLCLLPSVHRVCPGRASSSVQRKFPRRTP